ncbi:MAG: VWA domain-containing protein, partial [Betaproteobacteria bacterium]|nr:VWA domain-containing protein [Betaproteobacteria bacterium]
GEALRRRAERVPAPRGPGGLLLPRPETMRGLAQYAPVNLQAQDDDSPPSPQAADDLGAVQVARDTRACASRVRMDLEPDAANGEADAASGSELLPEWDWRRGELRPRVCVLHRAALPVLPGTHAFPERLDVQRRRLRRMFAALTPGRERLRAQPDGHDVDVDRYLRQRLQGDAPERVFVDTRERRRDLSCLLLADLSLSTDAAVSDGRQVIDVIRDGLLLFADTLGGAGDRFAIHGFHSHGRHDVRLHAIKTFDQAYGASTRARISATTPAGYTRMGAALRAATRMLEAESASQRLLLLLSDGKPNDADAYEGRYGIEDTRHAFLEARRRGLHPFCVTIDQQAHAYLPHVFGRHHFAVVRNAAELPQRLALLYARLRR